jgi:hypothetical protein
MQRFSRALSTTNSLVSRQLLLPETLNHQRVALQRFFVSRISLGYDLRQRVDWKRHGLKPQIDVTETVIDTEEDRGYPYPVKIGPRYLALVVIRFKPHRPRQMICVNYAIVMVKDRVCGHARTIEAPIKSSTNNNLRRYFMVAASESW